MPLRTLPVVDPSSAGRPTPIVRTVGAQEPRIAEYVADRVAVPSFHVWTLGCQMNSSDSEEMAGALLAAGCAEAPSLETADLIVINSCSVREAAEHKIIGRQGLLARLKAANPGVRVVLTGCAVHGDDRRRLARRYPAVDLFLRPDEEPELAVRLGLAGPTAPGRLGSGASAPPAAWPPALDAGDAGRDGPVGRSIADRLPGTRAAAVVSDQVARRSATQAWIPIVYGCDKTCTYCIVPLARGPERSRPFDEILAEARMLAAAGYQEVMLLGQNVNSYGHDLPAEARFAEAGEARRIGPRIENDGRPDIAALIRAIDGIRGAAGRPAIPRLRFITSHPWDLTDRLIGAMAECESVCEHLHLPVQSGSDVVLRRMGRQYSVGSYRSLIARLRDAVPEIGLTTDVIVGFPGEADEQFEETLALLREIRFDTVYAAAFSPRPGTPAAALPDDVPAAEKRRRLNTLLAVQEAIGLERNRAWLGRTTEVLVEESRAPRPHEHAHGNAHEVDARDRESERGEDAGRLSGRARDNRLVHFDGPANLVGRRVCVRVDRAGPFALAGSRIGDPPGSAGESA